MGVDLYFMRDEMNAETIKQLREENEKLREQIKVAAQQGMDGAKAGYEEVIERQRQRIDSLENMLGNMIDMLDRLDVISPHESDYKLFEASKRVLNADWR